MGAQRWHPWPSSGCCTTSKLLCVCVCRRQNDPVWSSDLPVCSHVHADGRQARLAYPSCPVPLELLLLRKAPHLLLMHTHAATCGFKCEPDHRAGCADRGRGGWGDGVEERREPVSHSNTAKLRNKRQGKADSFLHMVFLRVSVILRQS